MAVVNIVVREYSNPPLYNAIKLAFFKTDQVCYRPKADYQLSTPTFVSNSLIYNINNTFAAVGWYSDGQNRGQWTGTELINYQPCLVSWTPSEPYCVTDDIVINEFDFLVARFLWDYPTAGRDLDIQVQYENNSTPSVDNLFVGFGGQTGGTVPPSMVPPENGYLWWCLDDTNSSGNPQGIEGVIVNIKQFIADFPSSTNIVDVGIYAVWYNSVATGDFTFEVKTYKGGTMSKVGTDIVNTGGVLISNDTRSLNTLVQNNLHTPANSYKVGTLRYNKTTDTATLILG